MKQNRTMCIPDVTVPHHQNLSEFVCIFVTMRYHYAYSTSINMSKTIKVAFLLHLLPFDVAFSKTQTECECVTKAGIIPKHTSC